MLTIYLPLTTSHVARPSQEGTCPSFPHPIDELHTESFPTRSPKTRTSHNQQIGTHCPLNGVSTASLYLTKPKRTEIVGEAPIFPPANTALPQPHPHSLPSCIFALSSHHPPSLPPRIKRLFPVGNTGTTKYLYAGFYDGRETATAR